MNLPTLLASTAVALRAASRLTRPAHARGRHRLGVLLAAAVAASPLSGIAATPSPLSIGFHFSEQGGAELYGAICQGCHMPDARGAVGAGKYPALAANPNLASAVYITHNVIHGRHGMPGFGDSLDDAQVAAVVNYVRTHFDNHYTDAVTVADVKQAR